MLSIEIDELVYERQIYNKPIGLIKCKHCASSQFIAELEGILSDEHAKHCIVWMDYAAASQRQTQLKELQSLVSKLADGDIFKITMNASVRTLANEGDYSEIDDFQEAALAKLKRKLQRYFPSEMDDKKIMTDEGVSKTLCLSIKKAVLDGLKGTSNLSAIPLIITRYNDGHNMITVTGIILKDTRVGDFKEKLNLDGLPFVPSEWDDVYHVDIPDLSMKERIAIDELIGTGLVDVIHAKLPFKFSSQKDKSLKALSNYLEHYKRYPSFFQVIH